MSDDEYARQLEIQRANFEAQFGLIEDLGYKDSLKRETEEEEEEEEESDFNGFDESSELDSESKPKVVRLSTNHVPKPVSSKAETRLLRLGRAPTLAELEQKQQRRTIAERNSQAQAEKEDGEHMENDLKLQRLLSESHILASKLEYSGADVTLQTLDYEDPTGKARRRVLDARIRTAASINSKTNGLPSRLEKMPMHMRKGMIKSRDERIANYEREARDAGIVLARVSPDQIRNLDSGRGSTPVSDRLGKGNKVVKKVRDKGLRINGVGRSTRNGLVIAQKDIDRINRTGHRNNKNKKSKK